MGMSTTLSTGNTVQGDRPRGHTWVDTWRHHLEHIFSRSNKTSWATLLGLILYFVVGGIVYSQAPLSGENDDETFGLGNALYFCIVVVSTVGYGDFLPWSDGLKVFTAFYILFALVIASFCISNIITAMEKLAAQKVAFYRRAGIFELEKQKRNRRLGFLFTFLGFVSFIIVGTVGLALGEEESWKEEEGQNKWVNGFYMTVVTLTTVGFGDLTPSTGRTKILVCFLMVIGIPIFGASLSTLTTLIFGEQKDEITLNLIRGMDPDKFKGIEHFCEHMQEQGIPIRHKHQITRFEFLCFVLVQNGVVEIENIADAIKNFNALDVTETGHIDPEDIDVWMNTAKNSKSGQVMMADSIGVSTACANIHAMAKPKTPAALSEPASYQRTPAENSTPCEKVPKSETPEPKVIEAQI